MADGTLSGPIPKQQEGISIPCSTVDSPFIEDDRKNEKYKMRNNLSVKGNVKEKLVSV